MAVVLEAIASRLEAITVLVFTVFDLSAWSTVGPVSVEAWEDAWEGLESYGLQGWPPVAHNFRIRSPYPLEIDVREHNPTEKASPLTTWLCIVCAFVFHERSHKSLAPKLLWHCKAHKSQGQMKAKTSSSHNLPHRSEFQVRRRTRTS